MSAATVAGPPCRSVGATQPDPSAEFRWSAFWISWHTAYAFDLGRAAGYAACDRERDASWRVLAAPAARPTEHARDVAGQTLRAAEAGSRRDAAEHERAFVARAYATRPDRRMDAQRGTMLTYPPPGGSR
jgi:hypothetical protein